MEKEIFKSPSDYTLYVAIDPDERRAEVVGARSADEVAAYLPANYRVCGHRFPDGPTGKIVVLICGVDNAGWTLEDYVIPRLASGLMFATERINPSRVTPTGPDHVTGVQPL